jgi:uncharacterized SAM-binding protein YcdF (DUF218 family)
MFLVLFMGQLAVLSLWAFFAWRLDAYGRRPLSDIQVDAIIVPGCAVRWDGQPSGALARRTQHAISLYHEGLAPRLIFTGGVGQHPPAEAEVAAGLALADGIPPKAILTESRSTTTAENAEFSVLVDPAAPQWSVLVVTDGYHCWRCTKLFSRHFSAVASAGSTPSPRLRVRGAMREVISILRMWI